MGSLQAPASCPVAPSSACGYLLQELKLIWDEVGEDEQNRERVLHEIEKECLEVYKMKVDGASTARSRMHRLLADSEAELTNLLISLGERSPSRPEKLAGTMKEQLGRIEPALEEMRTRKEERVGMFCAVRAEILRVSSEIAGGREGEEDVPILNEADLSLKRLEEYRDELERLSNDKSERLANVKELTGRVHELAATMGMEAARMISEVHPSLVGSRDRQRSRIDISDEVLKGLGNTVGMLEDEKRTRVQKLQKLGKTLSNLWNLMDTPHDQEQLQFTQIIRSSSPTSASDHSLALDVINRVEAEVERLDRLKASKMRELFLKKKMDLQELCQRSHMEMPSSSEMEKIMNLITSGEMDHAELLTTMEELISKAGEEACSRKDIMEKVEKWMALCNEECWLEEYDMDENRYAVRRGGHKDLKRAERARVVVQKIPGLVELLTMKTKIWEEVKKKTFTCDEVPLLSMLEQYNLSRNETGEEKQRRRENKRLQGQAEAEEVFGSRPSTGGGGGRRALGRGTGGGGGGFAVASPSHQRRSANWTHQQLHLGAGDPSVMRATGRSWPAPERRFAGLD